MTALLDSIGLGGYTKWLVLGGVALVALGFALRWVLFAAKAAKLRRSVRSAWLGLDRRAFRSGVMCGRGFRLWSSVSARLR